MGHDHSMHHLEKLCSGNGVDFWARFGCRISWFAISSSHFRQIYAHSVVCIFVCRYCLSSSLDINLENNLFVCLSGKHSNNNVIVQFVQRTAVTGAQTSDEWQNRRETKKDNLTEIKVERSTSIQISKQKWSFLYSVPCYLFVDSIWSASLLLLLLYCWCIALFSFSVSILTTEIELKSMCATK